MSGVVLKRFTGFARSETFSRPEVWVNPAQVAYLEPRQSYRNQSECIEGTRIYFQQEAGVLDVRESVGEVVASLQSGRRGLCKDCYQELPEAWMSLCTPCREHRHQGVDEDYEAARADLAVAS